MPPVHLLSDLQNYCPSLLLYLALLSLFFYFKSCYCSFHRLSGGSKVRQMCSVCYTIWEALLCSFLLCKNICANCVKYLIQGYIVKITMILII